MDEKSRTEERALLQEEKRRYYLNQQRKKDELDKRREVFLAEHSTKQLTEEDFDRAKKVEERLGSHFMDMNVFAQKITESLPNVSSELIYRIQLQKLSKVWGVFLFMGLIMVFTVIAYSVTWGVD
jgi:hypothetical protein